MRTKLSFFYLGFIALAILWFGSIGSIVSAEDWKELKGDHFIIFHQGEDRLASEVLEKSEVYYTQISDDLGYERYSNFWLWEHRVKIYIYPTQEAFLSGTGRQNWSHGMADYTKKEIRTYASKEGFQESILPHEIAHLTFRDFVGFKGEVPGWLDEGVAQWTEPAKRAIVRKTMRSYLVSDKGYSIKDLTEIDIRPVPLTQAVQLYYVQAMSLVDFLITEHGRDDFINFCRQLRDGKNMDEALKFTYPTVMRSLNELEEQWRKYILAA